MSVLEPTMQCHTCGRWIIDPTTGLRFPGEEHAITCTSPKGPRFVLCVGCTKEALEALDHCSYEQMIEDHAHVIAGGPLCEMCPNDTPSVLECECGHTCRHTCFDEHGKQRKPILDVVELEERCDRCGSSPARCQCPPQLLIQVPHEEAVDIALAATVTAITDGKGNLR